MSDNVAPVNLSDDDAPFTGPNPGKDQSVSQRPETDDEIDSQEYYDEGLAAAAGMDEDDVNDDANACVGDDLFPCCE